MAPTPQDPEDVLELLGADEVPADLSPPAPDPNTRVDFPPPAPPRVSKPSAAVTGVDADLRARLDLLQKERVRLEQERVRLEKQLKAAQEAEKRATERAQRLETQLVEAFRATVLPSGDDGSALPSQGMLEQVPYARILQKLLRDRFTGRMVLRTGQAKREIYFEEGAPVAFTSSEPGERLGRVLVAHSCITEEQYLAAARAMVEMGTKLTEALLEMGAIDSQRLQQEQRQLTRDQILSGFALTAGSYALEPGKSPPEEASRFDFKIGELFLQGYRKHVPEAEIKSLYTSIKDAYVCLKPEMTRFRPQLGLDADDDRLLKMMGEAYTVSEAVEHTGLERDRAARLLAALVQLGLVEQWRPGVAEFEARLRAEKLRQAEQTLAIQQKMHEREEKTVAEFHRALQRLEEIYQVVVGPNAKHPSIAPAMQPVVHHEPPTQKEPADKKEPAPPPPPGAANVPRARRAALLVDEKSASANQPAVGNAAATEAVRPGARDKVPARDSSVDAALEKLGSEPVRGPEAPALKAVSAEIGKNLAQAGGWLPLEEPGAGAEGPGSDRFREGLRHAAAGRLDDAEASLREAVRLDAGRPAFLTALARVLLSNPRYERSGTLPVVRSLVDRAVTLAPNDPEVLALQQRLQAEMG